MNAVGVDVSKGKSEVAVIQQIGGCHTLYVTDITVTISLKKSQDAAAWRILNLDLFIKKSRNIASNLRNE